MQTLATGRAHGGRGKQKGVEDLDFHIGDDALINSKVYQVYYPIRHGLIDNWDHMERYWGTLCECG